MKKLLIYEKDFPIIHYDGPITDYTLCGLTTSGDDVLGLATAVEIRKRVNCETCIAIVNHVRGNHDN